MQINIHRQKVLRIIALGKQVLMFSKTLFLDIASRDRTTCLCLQMSRNILKGLIWTKFLIFDRRHHKGDDGVDQRKLGF